MQSKLSRLGLCNPAFDVMPLKEMIDKNDAGSWGSDPVDVSMNVVRSTNFNDTGYLDLSDVAKRFLESAVFETLKLEENEILIERSGGSETQPVGRVSFITKEVAEQGFAYANFIQRISVKPGIDPKYLFYCLYKMHSAGFTQIMQNQTNGIRNLEYRFFLKQLFPKPEFTEQQKIASILSSVDDTIKATRNSIAKLERLKKSLMQNLLTGKMKPDGTWRKDNEFYMDEKFGEVPIGWSVSFVGDSDVAVVNPNYDYEIDQYFDFLEMSDVDEKYKGVIKYEKIFIEKRNSGFAKFKNGDILFAKITPCTENGKIAFIEGCSSDIGFGSTEFISISPTENVDGYFLYLNLITHSVHGRAVALMEGTTGRQRVPAKIFKNVIQISVPEIEEQRLIAGRIKIVEDDIRSKFQKISKLEKLKKSLMQKLLTGQVRVK